MSMLQRGCEFLLDVCVFTGEAVLKLSHFQLLGVNGSVLMEALTHKKIIAKGEEVRVDTHCY